ncbi:hypothetical protein [Mesorhizobium sp.]|uniref:hypothetical protein n=1 Tax=Mesorhizobium sp. TaxID=1871066 RepID=UPI0012294C78|nr:hypothetical protein [Mesorhizobium sp.]TIO63866.1 MAG: hypothetical protein E5X85_35615 [Mesorhizobium sp.]TJV85485.1 MAG: hypothetical protein E5X84_32340 [Mesorhizobium sp.]
MLAPKCIAFATLLVSDAGNSRLRHVGVATPCNTAGLAHSLSSVHLMTGKVAVGLRAAKKTGKAP